MRLFTLLFFVFPLCGTAQNYKEVNKLPRQPLAPCTLPGMLPESAIPVCGTATFRQDSVSSCTGNTIAGVACVGGNSSSNAFWYKFHCYQAGTLGFLLTPQKLTDDYDWEIFDVTGISSLSEVYFNTNLMISLNLYGSGTNGPTGCTAAGIDSVNCGGPSTNPFNRLATLFAGHDYLLMVNNWSNSGKGYSLTFSGGTANITTSDPPQITGVEATCNTSQLKVNFSKDVMCSSVTGTGSEFTITSGTHLINSVTSTCNVGFSATTGLVINLQNPIAAGNYVLTVNDGADGNTFMDVCSSLMPAGTQIPFTVTAANIVEVDTVSFTGCAPTVLDVKLTRPVLCSSITPSGSEFIIQPGNIFPASVLSVCSGSTPNTALLHIHLLNPLPHGSYQLVINNGGDGDTFIDTCGNNLAATAIPFVIDQTAPAPVIQSVSFDECRPDRVVVNFDKPIACNSLAADGSDFSVLPGTNTISGIASTCTPNGFTSQVTLNIPAKLPAGNFNVRINTGSDGNTISDSCFDFMAVNSIKSFTTTQAPLPKFDSLQFDKCTPSEIKVFYSEPIDCGTVFAGGTEFYITGASPVNITSVSGDPATCFTSYSKWFVLHLAQPINIFGTYTLHNRWGPDGNSVADTCMAAQDTTETISFNVLGKPSASFISQVKFGCTMDTVILSHPGGGGINSWRWTFADGSAATGQTVARVFPVSTVTTSVQLIVANGFCSDTVSNSITLDNAFKAGFTQSPADTSCINTAVVFTDASTGKNLQYLWQFGDATVFNGKNTPPHIYSASGLYKIKLIVSDQYGCRDSASSKMYITPPPAIDFTGLATQYCTDKNISLVRVISNNIYTYIWDNGNGITFSNQPHVQFSYAKEGTYTVTLSGLDKYCGSTTVSKPVSIFDIPKINLGNDTVLCPAVTLTIGVPFTSGYTYLWSNGATSPQIVTDIFTSAYSLVADNNGCKATDAISVKVLPACLIRVPGAFTPNNDGLNDKLKAINADLAKAFTLRVYNRFGELMYATANPLEGWDGNYKGRRADAGTYVWQLSYIDPWSFKKVVERGTCILIR